MNDKSAWYVYVLRCADETFYCGITPNVEERLAKHNQKKAARYTRGRTPVELVYQEEQPDRSLATKREMKIKKMTREQKCKLINEKK